LISANLYQINLLSMGSSMKPFVTGSLIALTALSLTANVLMYFRYSSGRPLVTVGSQVITKKDYQDALDYQTHGVVLQKMVLADLVTQAARKANVMPTEADVEAQISTMRRQNPQELAAADQDPARMTDLQKDVQTQLALVNLQTQGISVSDTELNACYQLHKSAFRVPSQVQTTMVVTQDPVDAAQAAALLRQGIALDVIDRQPRLRVVGMHGFGLSVQSLPPAANAKLTAAVFQMKPGDVRTVSLGKDEIVIRAMQRSNAGVPPLAQIRPQVMRLAQLEKAVPAATEIAKLYKDANPQFAVARYAAYFHNLTGPDTGANAAQQTASAQ
jgi:hypothetical protein